MRILACLCLLFVPLRALATGNDLLYTGDPSTVSPGKRQLQVYGDRSYGAQTRVAGANLRFGTSNNTEVKLAYSYLWNFQGPNAQLGPNVGLKWRFVGNGLTNPSVAASASYAVSERFGAGSRRKDCGATLIALYPTKVAVILANLGRVWVGADTPDLGFMSYALVRKVSRTTLVAAEYSAINPLGGGPRATSVGQWALGTVYKSGSGWSYGFQVARFVPGTNVKWHTTVGVAVTF